MAYLHFKEQDKPARRRKKQRHKKYDETRYLTDLKRGLFSKTDVANCIITVRNDGLNYKNKTSIQK